MCILIFCYSNDIKDNYLLKDYLIDENSTDYNKNMSEELIKKYETMKKEMESENKKLYLSLVGAVILIIVIIGIAAILGS